jgi:hypothetical protein
LLLPTPTLTLTPTLSLTLKVNLIHCCPPGLPEEVFKHLSPRSPTGREMLNPRDGWIATYGAFLRDGGSFNSSADAQVGKPRVMVPILGLYHSLSPASHHRAQAPDCGDGGLGRLRTWDFVLMTIGDWFAEGIPSLTPSTSRPDTPLLDSGASGPSARWRNDGGSWKRQGGRCPRGTCGWFGVCAGTPMDVVRASLDSKRFEKEVGGRFT